MINGLTLDELEKIIQDIGEPKFRAKQLFDWLHQKLVSNYDQMGNLPFTLREKLKNTYPINTLEIVERLESKEDDTKKYLFKLKDDNIIESVFMQYSHGPSVCISTQVGCRMGCKFCASTVGGLIRNLAPEEMLSQVYEMIKDNNSPVRNIVLMGSGEPFENYDAVLKFIDIINSPLGQNIGIRHITVSTCGLVPEILKFADEQLGTTLAISLHSANDEDRAKIMPIARKYSLANIMDAVQVYIQKTNRRVTFEYGLIHEENDSVSHAIELCRLLKGINCHVNLIPINNVLENNFQASKNVSEFFDILTKHHIQVTVRRKLGSDIDASCGQLRRRYMSVK
ncbi:MAG: 23S rRNA (adenine(2503)-C(2))-methyltransferase [Candidatus Epulonipiscioides saccharophilum]|nr:MAG: 23S rRNA (adenine(2503)-C(2))-methyltransferase [Epulopiscium sp. AS2M-Bin001]